VVELAACADTVRLFCLALHDPAPAASNMTPLIVWFAFIVLFFVPQVVGSSQTLLEATPMAAAAHSAGAYHYHTLCSGEPKASSCCMCSSSNCSITSTRSGGSSAYSAEHGSSTAWSARARGCDKQFAGFQDSAQPGGYPVLCVDPASWQQQALPAAEHSDLAAVHCSRVESSSSWPGHYTVGGESAAVRNNSAGIGCTSCSLKNLHLQRTLSHAAVCL
jgi:hypothetical protein